MIVPELSSTSLPLQPTRLVAFPSFSSHQLHALLAEFQPTFISVIHGEPPRDEDKWRKKAIEQLNQTDKLHNAEYYTASTLDPTETVLILRKIYQSYGDTNRLLVAPIGSKMQAVAVAIFRQLCPEIQIVYPTPASFTQPSSHTHGSKQIYYMAL